MKKLERSYEGDGIFHHNIFQHRYHCIATSYFQ
jgi:hypothetical protein